MTIHSEITSSYRGRSRRIRGVVVSDRMQKTVVVAVTRIKEHPKYKKRFRVVKKYKAHDEHGNHRVGDEIIIEETRPFSRSKRWRVVQRIGIRETKEEDGGVGTPLGMAGSQERSEAI